MKRRKLLSSTASLVIGASVAGCSYFQDAGSEIQITNIDTPTFDYIDLSFDAISTQKTPTTESPAMVKVQVTNNSDINVLFKDLQRTVFDAFINTNTDDYKMHLYRPDIIQTDSVESTDCWKLNERVIHPKSNLEMILWSDESKSIELSFIPGLESPNCLPKGQYTFETMYDIYNRESDQLIRNVNWAFDIEVI